MKYEFVTAAEQSVLHNSLLPNVHFLLKTLINDFSDMSFLLESIYNEGQFEEMGNPLKEDPIRSIATALKLRLFHLEWQRYRKNVAYSDDKIFIQLDERWIKIINDYLKPALKSIEKDFDQFDVKYISYKQNVFNYRYPTNEELLSRANYLYELLLKHEIIDKFIFEDD